MDRMAAEMITGFAFIILITVVVTMRTMYTVSYTHLTLPTICSV